MPALELPLAPESDEAREWLVEELSRKPYSQGTSVWQWILEQIQRLIDAITSVGSGLEAVFLPLVILTLIAGIIILALLYGRPRRGGRKADERPGAMWQEDDTRTSVELRRSATNAAAAGDYTLAVIEQFRATIRSLEEIDTIETTAGMTAGEVGRQVSALLPTARGLAGPAAVRFNQSLYGAVPATEADYAAMVAFDAALSETAPAAPGVPAS